MFHYAAKENEEKQEEEAMDITGASHLGRLISHDFWRLNKEVLNKACFILDLSFKEGSIPLLKLREL